MDDVLRQRRKRGLRLALLGLTALAALVGVYVLRDIFAPLIAGFLIAYVLDPAADALERLRFSRLASVIIIFSIASAVAILFFLTAGFYITKGVISGYHAVAGDEWLLDPERVESPVPGEHFDDVDGDGAYEAASEPWLATWTRVENPRPGRHYLERTFNDRWDPGYLRSAKVKLDALAVDWFGDEWQRDFDAWWRQETTGEEGRFNIHNEQFREELVKRAQQVWQWRRERAAGPGGAADSGGALEIISWFIFCPLYVFFFLLEIDVIIAALRDHLPGKQRPVVVDIFRKIDRVLSAFFRGRLLICLVKGALTAAGLWLLGVPFAFPIGLAAGFLALIPYIGIWLAIIPALILCWVDGGSLWQLGGVMTLFMVLEAVEGVLLVPLFLGKEVGLHPLTIIVTLLIFGRLLGFIGVLLSVPLAAIAKILGEIFLLPLIRGFAAEQPDAEPDESTGGG